MCVWNQACDFCLCCMRSSNPPPLNLDLAQYRHSSRISQVTLLPLSPLPPVFSPAILFSRLYLLLTSCLLSFTSYPTSLSPLLAVPPSFYVLLLLQPLMTCLKPTVGSTVREGTEALPSHRPSQRAAAQGKVHAQHSQSWQESLFEKNRMY